MEKLRVLLEVSGIPDKYMLIIKREKTPEFAIWLSQEEIEELKLKLNMLKYNLKK